MSSTYSPKLRFELVGAGEQAGLWGTTTNKNVGQLIEQAIAGVTTVELDGLSGNYTLTALDGTPDQSRSAVIKCTYATVPAAGAINLIIPTQTKLYVVRNDCGQTITVKTAAQAGGATPPVLNDGEATLVFCDGTDAILGLETAAAGTLGVDGGGTGRSTFTAGVLYSSGGTNALSTYTSSAAIPVSYGGTGSNTLTANNVLLGNGTSALQVVAPGSNGNVLTSNGTTWVSSAPASSGVTSITASTGLSASGPTGAVTLTNTGVTSLTAGTGITLSGSTGSVTVSSTVIPSDYVTVSGTQTVTGIKTFGGGGSGGDPSAIFTYGANFNGGDYVVSPYLNFNQSGTSWYLSGSQVRLDISNTNAFNTTTSTAIFTMSDVQKPGGGSFNTTSDARLKENIVDYAKGLTALKQLHTVNYNYNDITPLGSQTEHKTFTGLIAQEVEQTPFANMVKTDADGYKSLDSSELVYALINAVKELSAEVDALKAKLG